MGECGGFVTLGKLCSIVLRFSLLSVFAPIRGYHGADTFPCHKGVFVVFVRL